MPYKDQKVKIGILKLVEFVAIQLQWVPSQELVAMTILFKGDRWVFTVKLKLDNLLKNNLFKLDNLFKNRLFKKMP